MSETYRAPAFADALPELSGRSATEERVAFLGEHGFVIIDDFVGSPWIEKLRDAGRRLTEAFAPENMYDVLDGSKGYVHRNGDEEPWAIRGIVHPAWKEPSFAEFHGSDEFLGFVSDWTGGVTPEDLSYGGLLLWCNPRKKDHALGWHRDVTWWGTGESYRAQESRDDGPDAYSEEVERERWAEITERNRKSLQERNGASIFLALVDDECHEVIPGSHNRWRTAFEHDVLLPKKMKDAGVPHTPSWDGEGPLPEQTAVRLKAGQALLRVGSNIHTGHTVPERERNSLAIGWSKWGGPSDKAPEVVDARHAWQLDPAVREALPHEWMKTAWDRWSATQKLGDTLEDRYAGFDIPQIKAGKVAGWDTELEKQAAAAGDAWESGQTAT
jgi:hypothetical protein